MGAPICDNISVFLTELLRNDPPGAAGWDWQPAGIVQQLFCVKNSHAACVLVGEDQQDIRTTVHNDLIPRFWS